MRRESDPLMPSPDPPAGAKVSRFVGAREAELILGIARTTLHELAASGRLPGRLIDKRGPAHWQFKRSDVLHLLASGKARKHKQRTRKQIELWRHYFGAIPEGLTAAFRDKDRSNVAPDNICLVPLAKLRRRADVPRTVKRSVQVVEWTAQMTAKVRRLFPTTITSVLATELGVSPATVRRQARKLKLRKARGFVSQTSRTSNRLPIGAERLHDSTGSVWVKVSHDGNRHCERWRPKQHIVWEQATARTVPRGYCVMFKDGNKQNFNLSNLELITRREMSARGFARFVTYPESLQTAIRLTRKLEREIGRRVKGIAQTPPRKGGARPGAKQRRWTTQMDRVLRRDYPTKPIRLIMATLGVSETSLRNRAKRLKVRRSPETIIAQAREAAMSAPRAL